MRKELTWKGAVMLAAAFSAMLGLTIAGTGCVPKGRLRSVEDLAYQKGIRDAYEELAPKVQKITKDSEALVQEVADDLKDRDAELEALWRQIEEFYAAGCSCAHKHLLPKRGA